MQSNQSFEPPNPGFPDEFGFQEKNYNTDEIFSKLRKFNAEGVPLDTEKIKIFTTSRLQIVIVTDQNKVYRQKESIDGNDIDLCFEHIEVPESKIENQNKEFIGNIKDMGKKILFMGSSTQRASIDKVFLDPSGYHCILTSQTGVNFYLNYEHSKIKPLKNIKGPEFILQSIAWDNTCTQTSTKTIIFGTSEGVLYSYRIETGKTVLETNEQMPEKIVQLRGEKPILQLFHLKLGDPEKANENSVAVIASTNSSIFSFIGSDLITLFSNYKTTDQLQAAELSFHANGLTSIMSVCLLDTNFPCQPRSILWTNGLSLQHFKIPEKQFNSRFLHETEHFKYAKMYEDTNAEYKVAEMPVDMILTEFHYFLLHSDSLTIMSRINQSVVQKYDLKSMGIVFGCVHDQSTKSLYIYSAKSVQRLSLQYEDQDAWLLYFEKKEFKLAYEACLRTGQEASEYIGGIYADQLFEGGQYQKAAEQYFQTARSFEEITLKFLSEQLKDNYEAIDGLESTNYIQ